MKLEQKLQRSLGVHIATLLTEEQLTSMACIVAQLDDGKVRVHLEKKLDKQRKMISFFDDIVESIPSKPNEKYETRDGLEIQGNVISGLAKRFKKAGKQIEKEKLKK